MRAPLKQEALPYHEFLLGDYAERLARHLGGRRAVHVHLSKLRPFNRRAHHIRIAANACETLCKRFEGQLFVMLNGDLVLVVKGATVHEIDQTIVRLRFLFSDDPLAANEEDGDHAFCTWYDLERQYESFRELAQRFLAIAERRKALERGTDGRDGDEAVPSPRRQPLDPLLLGRLEQNLAGMDLLSLVRRQPVCVFLPGGPPKAVFNEVYVSISELRRRVIPDVDLAADRWLFMRLTQTLDLRILSLLPELEGSITLSTSLNVNVSTILSPQFLAFDSRLRTLTNKTMVLELQPIDIFGDVGAFIFARDFVRERGYRVCLDGLNHLAFPLVQREQFGFDLQKIIWSSDLEEDVQEQRRQQFLDAVKAAGTARVVLCRCDSPRAVEFGQSIGISMFQGRYIDNLLADRDRLVE